MLKSREVPHSDDSEKLHNQYMDNLEPIRIAIADDHSVVQKLIQSLVEKHDDMEVVATAVNGIEAIDIVEQHQPDIIIMDISMPKMNGLQASKHIIESNSPTQIIILSMHHNESLVKFAEQNGVSQFVSKQNAVSELIPAIRSTYKKK